MPKNNSLSSSTMFDIEIVNIRTKKRRVIEFNINEKVLYNAELKDFQLLPYISSSYEQNSEQPHD